MSLLDILAGGFAGLVSTCLFYPIDSYKAHQQYLLGHSQELKGVKLRGYYRGISVVAAFSVPSVAIYFATLEKVKSMVPGNGYLKEVLGGVSAQITSSVIAAPRDFVKLRLQVQHLQPKEESRYRGPWTAAYDIARNQGIRGLFRGWTAEVTLWSVYSSLYLISFRIVKDFARKLTGYQQVYMPVWVVAPCASIASGITAWITNPIDVFKVQYQTKQSFGDFTQVAREIHSHGAWFRGSVPRVLSVAPRTALSFSLFEFFKSFTQ